ncbi:MAG TPA: hypothetical protein VLF59_03650 [Candidatus Saccharimonadales bacterium]|nr:hypothetical protein [Candidatus Saccharimonadales bacterium]
MSSIVRGAEGALQFEHGDGMPFGHELAAAYDTMSLDRINEETAHLKRAVAHFVADKDTALVADSIHANYLASPVLKVGGTVLEWLACASDDDLLTFSVANARHHTKRSEQLGRAEPQLREDMLSRAEWLKEIGYLPPHASDVYKRANSVAQRLRRMDFFEAGAMAATGYYQLGSGTITLADQFSILHGGPTTALCDTSFHEFTHVAGDISGGFVTQEAPPDDLVLVEEAIVSHTTQISDKLCNPRPDILDPDARGEVVQGSYADVRKLVSILARCATRTLCVSDMSEAFFTPPAMSVRARMHVELRLDAAVRELLPGYHATGLRQFSQDYNEHHAANTAAGWVDAQIRATTGLPSYEERPAELTPTSRAIVPNLIGD